MIAVIGVREFIPVEIACSCCDDIEWRLPQMIHCGDSTSIGQMRMDCAFRSGAMHAWAHDAIFRVGVALSSTSIELIKKKAG